MACLVNVISVAIVVCSIVKNAAAQGAQVQANDNAEQFALLCGIYNVAKNPPINHVDFQDPNKIVEDIDALNASFVEDKRLNETEHVENTTDVQLKRTTTRDTAVAQALLSQITRKTHDTLKEIRKLNATRDIEKAKGRFTEVIFGEGMNETHLCQGALNGIQERGAACGASGLHSRGGSAGNNLVVDFFCLCAMRTKDGEGIGNVCGVEVGSKSEKHSWGNTAPSGSASMWASIKKECGKHLQQNPKRTQECHEVLEDFLMHLKTGGLYRWGTSKDAEGSGRKPGMLGTAAGTESKGSENDKDFLCDGKRGYTEKRKNNDRPHGGICVYYGPESEWDNIDWLKKLRTALNEVDTLNNKTATIQRDIDKLEKLLHRAEQIYETTKVITEIQKPVLPTNLQTAAKRLTAYNAAWRHYQYHFILLFVLL